MGNRKHTALLVCIFAALVGATPAYATQGPFFLDTHNQLWAATDATGKTYQFTGASGIQLSVGTVNTFGPSSGTIAVVRTAGKRVQIYNSNNNAVTHTGISAKDIAAGRGKVYIRRPDNKLAVLTLGALNPDGTFGVTVTPTTARVFQMSVGFDFTAANDFLAFRGRGSRVRFMEVVAGAPVFGSSSLKAIDLAAGNQKETFLRQPNNRLAVLTIATATAAGITLHPAITSTRRAVQMSVSRNNPAGDDYMVFRAPDKKVHFADFAPATPAVTFVDVPGAVAKQVVAGVTEIFIRRPSNQVQYFTLNGTGTGIASTTSTGVFATQLRDTRITLGPGVIDQIAIVKGQRLFVSQNDTPGTAIASFFNTGFFVKDVLGYTKFP